MEKADVLFPFAEIRTIQDQLIAAVAHAVDQKSHLTVHAPTGLGKTVASLGPALKKAQEEKLTVFFLTSRHTQHKIALETLQAVKRAYGLSIPVVNMVGKKHMCLQPGIELLGSGEFTEYCKKVREDGTCEFYVNARKDKGEPTMEAVKLTQDLIPLSPFGVEKVIEEARACEMCPYEISLMLAKEAKVVVADYFYLFSPGVRERFLKRAGKDLTDCIIIVDEAHNLPGRLREVMTTSLSTLTLKYARNEANDLNNTEAVQFLDILQEHLLETIGMLSEKVVRGLVFPQKEEMIELFDELAEITREAKKRSWLGSVASFLQSYADGVGFVNIIRHIQGAKGQRIELTHHCLDPSILSQPIFDMAYASIVMSGTLTPVNMYQELLGLRGKTLELPSPFPKENRLSMIVPTTTTKFSSRTIEEYKRMGTIIGNIIDSVPGNSAVFFPSYTILGSVKPFIETKKTIFTEHPGMTKPQRDEMLESFKEYSTYGAGLLGVAAGSYGEGIDLPGDLLKCVVIVGLPLTKPDLETQALIDYYQNKYGHGWDYGYVLPALAKVMQNAGRCIRSETDKGVIVFLDKRYVMPNYRRVLVGTEVALDPIALIQQFFEQQDSF